ncbi:MAG: histone deacetylase family protein [Alphaproteobacteria bacterium]|nr:histone deacetylase family protein [Alphaproteobacteria bacterium]
MTTILYTHAACLAHDTGPGHPERAERLTAVLSALADERFSELERREAPAASVAQIARAHPQAYVEALLGAIPKRGYGRLDPDTVVSPGSGEAARRAAGALIAAVDAVMAGEARNAFCAVRPCGHHAEPVRAMGFCLFNNVVIGALHAREAYGLRRVAVLDFDVHHGNGTQVMFDADPDLFFASSHQHPFYPGTGARTEVGVGNIVNEPLEAGAGSHEFRAAWQGRILPALDTFAPEFVFVSAGFDAHADDPLAALRLGEDDFAWVTRELAARAARHCAGRLVSVLEGGYDLRALGESCARHVSELMVAARREPPPG